MPIEKLITKVAYRPYNEGYIMDKSLLKIPAEIKRDWRLPVYLLAVSVILFVSLVMNLFPSFQVFDAITGAITDNVSGFVANFGGMSLDTYYPLLFGISAQAFVIIGAISALAFSLLLKLRRTDGVRRFSLIIISLSANLLALVMLFISLIQFKEVNGLALAGLDARYHYGLVLQAMLLFTAGYIQWFFFIKIRHYIK